MQSITKQEVRKTIGTILRNIAPESRISQSTLITSKLLSLNVYKEASSVAMYLSMKTEVETQLIMDDCFISKKKVLVPKILTDHEFELVTLQSKEEVESLQKDKWGIPIPQYNDSNRMVLHPETTPSVIIVPGVAFDSKCKRMGHGKGFYGNHDGPCFIV